MSGLLVEGYMVWLRFLRAHDVERGISGSEFSVSNSGFRV